MEVRIKYFIWGSGSDWEGLCTTFDIAMEGESLEETKQSLKDAVRDYLAEIEQLPEKDRQHLLNRKSPFFERMTLEAKFRSFKLGKAINYVSPPKITVFGAHSTI